MPREEYTIDSFHKGMKTAQNPKDINNRQDKNKPQGRELPTFSSSLVNLKSPEWTTPQHYPHSMEYDWTEFLGNQVGIGSQGLGGSLSTFDWSENAASLSYKIAIKGPTRNAIDAFDSIWIPSSKIAIKEVMLPFWNGSEGGPPDFGIISTYSGNISNFLGYPLGEMRKIPHNVILLTGTYNNPAGGYNNDTCLIALKQPSFLISNGPHWGLVSEDGNCIAPYGVTEVPIDGVSPVCGDYINSIPGTAWICSIKEEIAKYYNDDYMMSLDETVLIPDEIINTAEGFRISFGKDIPMFSCYFYERNNPLSSVTSNTTSNGVTYSEKELAFYLGIAELPTPPVDWLHRDTSISQWDSNDTTDEMQYIHMSNFGSSPDADFVFDIEGEENVTITTPGDRPYKVGVCFAQPDSEDAFYDDSGHGFDFSPPNASSSVVGEEIQLGLSYYDAIGNDGRVSIGRVLSTEGYGAQLGTKWEISTLPINDSDGNDIFNSRQIQVKIHDIIKTGGTLNGVDFDGIQDRIDGVRLWARKASSGSWKLLYDFNFTLGECISGFTGEPHAICGDSSSLTNKYWVPNASGYFRDFYHIQPAIPFEGITRSRNADLINPSADSMVHFNNVLYLANAMYYEYTLPEWKKEFVKRSTNDTIYISRPGAFDTFSQNRHLDIAHDGGFKITALKQSGDKLLVFKENSLTVISLAKAIPRVIYTKEFCGMSSKHHYAETSIGPMWANISGVFVYSGKGVINITENLLSTDDWQTFYNHSQRLTTLYDEETNNILFFDAERAETLPISGGNSIYKGIPKAYNFDLDHFSVVSLSNSTLVWSSDGRDLMQMVNPMTKLTENVSWTTTGAGPAGWTLWGSKIKPGFGSVTDFAYESAELDLDSMGQTKKFKKLYIRYMANKTLMLNCWISIDGGNYTKITTTNDLRRFVATDDTDVPFAGEEGVKVFDISSFAGFSIKVRLSRVERDANENEETRETEVSPGFLLNSLTFVFRKKLVK